MKLYSGLWIQVTCAWTYFQAAKSSVTSSSTQTDENIKKIKLPPLKFLQTASSDSKPNMSASIPTVSTSSSSTQARLSPSTIS
ncbi:hypothetical protein TNCV_3464931 [Trichonephila clavipes]|nr:hypothetical protein TNCV_3464931 [Trichonephila clavipes]